MKRNLAKIALPLFFFWPFGSFLMALTNIKAKSSAIIYILFSLLFGYSFTFQSVGADSYRYSMVFLNYDGYRSIAFILSLFNEGSIRDIYVHLAYVIVHQFTNNPKILFALFGFIFGIFSYLSLYMLVDLRIDKKTKMLFIIALVFFSFYPLTAINGVRFNTAALVFFCSFLNIFIYKHKAWFLALLLTPLIHFSYILCIPFVLILWLLKPYFKLNKKDYNWVYGFFFITLIISVVVPTNFISLGFLQDSDMISNSATQRFQMYNSDEATITRAERLESSLFLNVSKYFGYVTKVFLLFLVIQIKKKYKTLSIDSKLNSFYYVVLLFISFGFITSTFPSGGRFLAIGYMFFYYLFYQLYDRNRIIGFNNFIMFMPIIYSFQLLYSIGYLSINLINSSIWYGNLIWILFF